MENDLAGAAGDESAAPTGQPRKPAPWHAPTITRLSLQRTLFDVGSGADGSDRSGTPG